MVDFSKQGSVSALDLYFVEGDDWSAVYYVPTGELVSAGDTYAVREKIDYLTGLGLSYRDDIKTGDCYDSKNGTVQNLDEVFRRRDAREAQLERAQELRAQAEILIKEAEALEFR